MNIHHLGVSAMLALGLVACSPDATVEAPSGSHEHAAPVAAVGASGKVPGAVIKELRDVTVPFHDIAAAASAGWDTPLTGCLDDPTGGMGYHVANLGLLDATINASEPEALLYEPMKNGKMRLVGVEYIVPRPAWTGEDPPTLFGQEYPYVPAFDVYGLHVWLWRDNPLGMFAPWNPKVSCQFAPAED